MKNNSLINNAIFKFRYFKFTIGETFAYLAKGIARELNFTPACLEKYYEQTRIKTFLKKYLRTANGISYFDFNGAKLPDISDNIEKLKTLLLVFEDVFLVPVYHNDNYDKSFITALDQKMGEGPYGYTDGNFDVTVKSGDIVIDAGAWIGDFSAYSASRGAEVYAFEPVAETFYWLQKTAELNNGKIYPVQKGLNDSEEELQITVDKTNSGSNSLVKANTYGYEKIIVTTLDKFVEENKIEKVDFIKSDIEGAERNLLKGAVNVLKTFAPKLAICTYHLPDDPEVLEQIIKNANPNYTVVHLKHKLFATVI